MSDLAPRLAVWTAILTLTLASVCLTTTTARAQDYPSRPITLHLAANAAHGEQQAARILADFVARNFDYQQPVAVVRARQGGVTEFVRAIDSLRNLGHDLAIVSYPLVALEGLAEPVAPGARSLSWRDISVLGAIAYDPVVLVGAPPRSVPAAEILAEWQQQPALSMGWLDSSLDLLLTSARFASLLRLRLDLVRQPDLEQLGRALEDQQVRAAFVLSSDIMATPAMKRPRILALASSFEHPSVAYATTFPRLGIPLVASRHYVLAAPRRMPARTVRIWRRLLDALHQDRDVRLDFYALGQAPGSERATGDSGHRYDRDGPALRDATEQMLEDWQRAQEAGLIDRDGPAEARRTSGSSSP